MEIALEKMRFFAFHGAFDEEREKGNQFEVDIYFDSPLDPSLLGDNLEETLDYGEAYAVVKEVMEGDSVKLLETLVGRIGQLSLDRLHLISGLKVRVSKLNPPLNGDCERSYVEAEFRK